MENKSNSKKRPLTVDDVINEIKQKSSAGDYIYRGERKHYIRVSSAFYRQYRIRIRSKNFDLRIAEKEMLNAAKKHLGEPLKDVNEDIQGFLIDDWNPFSDTEVEILTELQHYGGKTNLIDFTTDYLIAIFFACSGRPKDDGRVILLQKTTEIEKEMIIRPQNPRHRIIAQKSVFLHPPDGYIKPHEDDIVNIPATLKQTLLQYLRKYHDLSPETIYNDIHGFITNENIHKSAYIEFYLGLSFQSRASYTKNDAAKRDRYEKAISHYSEAIDRNSEINTAYGNRGECWLHLEEWDNARKDLETASNMGASIISAFRNDYKNGVKEFESKTGLTMPSDLAKMLGG